MNFHKRTYQCLLLFAPYAESPLYLFRNWGVVHDAFDSLMREARGEAVLRVSQLQRGTGRPVKFGLLRWSAPTITRWTFASPAPALPDASREFMGVQAWAPSPQACQREDHAPDVFLHLHACRSPHEVEHPLGQGFMAAGAMDFLEGRGGDAALLKAFSKVAEITSPTLLARQESTWGQELLGGRGYTYALSDFLNHGVPVHKEHVVAAELRGQWKEFTLAR